MRLPYAPPTPPPTAPAATAAIYARIAARRAPRPPIPLDLALLHSPDVADGWNAFLGAVRGRTVVPPRVLELAVCRVAVLNGAVYEWNVHAALALRAGLGAAGLAACRSAAVVGGARGVGEGGEKEVEKGDEGGSGGRGQGEKDGLGEREWAVLRYTDQMTKNVEVDEEVFARLKALFTEREVVEITACVAAYNCVSRFLVALDVGEWNGTAMKSVEELVEEVRGSEA